MDDHLPRRRYSRRRPSLTLHLSTTSHRHQPCHQPSSIAINLHRHQPRIAINLPRHQSSSPSIFVAIYFNVINLHRQQPRIAINLPRHQSSSPSIFVAIYFNVINLHRQQPRIAINLPRHQSSSPSTSASNSRGVSIASYQFVSCYRILANQSFKRMLSVLTLLRHSTIYGSILPQLFEPITNKVELNDSVEDAVRIYKRWFRVKYSAERFRRQPFPGPPISACFLHFPSSASVLSLD
jgi:sRNA-binding carbon storage regulator CsrA